jgi:ABC-type transport system involved in multi-copper enzyme maturation permease subunit
MLGLVMGQLLLLILVVPGIAGVSLVGEREANTLEMLYASRLSASQIIVGKTLSSLAVPMVLLLTGLPFAALLSYRGELDAGTLGTCYAVLVVAAVLLAIGSLTISAICKQSSTALVVSYLAALIVCGGLLVPATIMLKSESGAAAQALHYARALSPVGAVLSIVRPEVDEVGGRAAAIPQPDAVIDPDEQPTRLIALWKVYFPLASVVIAACFATLARRLSRPPTVIDDSPGAGRGITMSPAMRRLLYVIDERKPRGPMIGFNPMLSKEARTTQLRSGRWMLRIFYASLVLSLLLAVMALYGGVDHPDLLGYVARVIVTLQAVLVALVVPSLTSSAISSEIEAGTFESLRLTPLSGNAMFWGKFLPALLPALLPIVALLPAFGTICFVDPGYVPFFTRLAAIVVMSVALCAAIGLTCSSFADNTPRATVASYLITAALFVLPVLACQLGETHLAPRLTRWLALPSPLAVGLNLLPGDTAAPLVRDLWLYHVALMMGVCVVALITARARLAHLLRHGS